MKKLLFVLLMILMALCIPLESIADYTSSIPMPDKYLMPDGSITTWGGVVVCRC